MGIHSAVLRLITVGGILSELKCADVIWKKIVVFFGAGGGGEEEDLADFIK